MNQSPNTNLIHGEWTQESLRELLVRHPARPLLPPLGGQAWREAAKRPLVRELIAPLRALADAECDEPLPVLTDELYADFKKTGIRLTFERVYFERRRRLAWVAISLLVAEDSDPARSRLAASLVSKFQDIFEEVSWALPAHVNWHNDDNSGKEPMRIDLFCAETANLMAEILDVFGEVIPEELQVRVRERLQKAIFENYLSTDFHWMRITNNWNAVCHQGVVGAALSQVDDPDQLAAILFRMRAHLPHFLEGFEADGGCSEGPGYWDYGFGWFAMLNEQLEKRTDGELSLFDGDELVKAIALYGPRMSLSNGMLVNFSDGSASTGLDPALLSYLGKRLDEETCRVAAEENFLRLQRNRISNTWNRSDFLHLARWVLASPAVVSEGSVASVDCFLPDLEVLVARGVDASGHMWEFAAKGGHNAEHHNHNDCGSFLLNIDGQRRLIEIGSPEYVHDFFQPERRYQYLAARSLGHSVPLVNGCEQSAGAEFAAKVQSASCGSDLVEFTVDLTNCYPAEALCRKLLRTFRFEKSAGVLAIVDEYELDEPGEFESILITFEKPESKKAGVDVAGLRIVPGEGTQFVASDLCGYRDHQGCDAHVHRLRFSTESGPLQSGRIALTLSLAE
jgi:hypothetical protein